VIIEKHRHRLMLYSGNRLIRAYRVALGHTDYLAKSREGDGRTPEGAYVIDRRNPNSAFHLALHISYPNAQQIRLARAKGLNPGGDIMIHGLRNGFGWIGRFHRLVNWTNGCVAVTNPEIDQIWHAVPDGTPVSILP
jgi:murein L,D-transpeptidase YafK